MKESYSIKEISELFQLPESKLRFWESKGIITPKRNKSSGYREYTMQSIVEISDIVLYRSLNFSIKELKRLSKMNVDNLALTMAKSEESIESQINSLLKIRNEITKRKSRFEEYNKLIESPYTVSCPSYKKIIPAASDNSYSMHLYLKEYYDYILTTHSNNPSELIEGLSVEADYPFDTSIWRCSDNKEEYIECLVTAKNGNSSNNDLCQHIEYVKNQGYAPSIILAKFLFSCYSDKDSQFHDYYHGWIKIG